MVTRGRPIKKIKEEYIPTPEEKKELLNALNNKEPFDYSDLLERKKITDILDQKKEPVIEELDIKKSIDTLIEEHVSKKPKYKYDASRCYKICDECGWKGFISEHQIICPMVGCSSSISISPDLYDHVYEKELEIWEEELDYIKNYVKNILETKTDEGR